MLRSRVWAYLVKKLPSELWKSLNEGDVRGLYIYMLNLNSANSNSQILELQGKVLKFAKKGKPMRVWLDEFYDLLDKLDKLRAPADVVTVRTVIVESLKGDTRYKDALRDLKRNQGWNIPTIRRHLEAAARECKDLVRSIAQENQLCGSDSDRTEGDVSDPNTSDATSETDHSDHVNDEGDSDHLDDEGDSEDAEGDVSEYDADDTSPGERNTDNDTSDEGSDSEDESTDNEDGTPEPTVRVGDIVQLLDGTAGQVVGPGPDGRFRVQCPDYLEADWSSDRGQWVINACHVGLKPHEFVIIQSQPSGGGQPLQPLHQPFDTGWSRTTDSSY